MGGGAEAGGGGKRRRGKAERRSQNGAGVDPGGGRGRPPKEDGTQAAQRRDRLGALLRPPVRRSYSISGLMLSGIGSATSANRSSIRCWIHSFDSLTSNNTIEAPWPESWIR